MALYRFLFAPALLAAALLHGDAERRAPAPSAPPRVEVVAPRPAPPPLRVAPVSATEAGPRAEAHR